MSKEAFLFPGQGSQKTGMGENLVNHPDPELSRIAKHTFEEANDVLQMDYKKICFENTDGILDRTLYTQPSLLIVSTAAMRMLEHQGLTPDIVAGHSLGEYSALVAAHAIEFPDALKLVSERGRSMEEAMKLDREMMLNSTGEENPGRMAAILGLPLDTVEDIVNQPNSIYRSEIANINAEGQIVIAGRDSAIDNASRLTQAMRGKMRKLNVSIASHCSLMEPAKLAMSRAVDIVDFKKPALPFVGNVSGSFVSTAEGVKRGLVDQMTGTVQWLDTMKIMVEDGVETITEVGPGEVLSNLMKRTAKEVSLKRTDTLFTIT